MSIDPTLHINTFALDRRIVPQEAQYIEYSSASSGGSLSFDIRSPNENSLLDSEVWIKHAILIEPITAGDNHFRRSLSLTNPDAKSARSSRSRDTLYISENR